MSLPMHARILAISFALAVSVLAQTPSQKHPFTFEDMMALKRVGAPVPSPDGKWVVFDCEDVDLAANTKISHLWIVPASGGESRRLNPTPNHEERPRFSPDGKRLIWTSKATDPTQIWMCDFDPQAGQLVGKPHQVTSISTGADGAIWSPDGKNIVFVSAVYPDCKDEACNKQRDEELKKSKVKAKIFSRLFYRHWNAFTEFKRSHLFVIPAEAVVAAVVPTAEPNVQALGTSASTTPRDLTPGDHDVPPFHLGGQDTYAISPDGQEVAYTSNIFEADKWRLLVQDRQTGKTRDLTEKFDRSVGSFDWQPDSSSIAFAAEDHGEAPIYFTPVVRELQEPLPIRQVFHADDLKYGTGSQLYFTRMSVAAPNEIWGRSVGRTRGAENAAPWPITHMNDTVLSKIDMQPLESFTFKGANDDKVQGFMVKPPGFDPNKKYPLKFLIHGGPQGAWGNSWTYRWNAELFAASGNYVVVMINFHGSTGYGQKFTDSISGDWGGKPYVDLMKGLDYVEKTYPFIDKNREAALGASYGGYMANWLL